jgi:NAD(P)H-dependent flavin oxidoreductase YrpB (nitropropane dioxygenase family)
MRTALTALTGVDFPIFAFTHCRDVVAAVTNAGGMGVLGAVAHTPEQLAVDLAWIREQTKGRPFGVDLLIPRKYVGSEAGGLGTEGLHAMVPAEHRAWIDALLERYDVPALPGSSGENAGERRIRVDPAARSRSDPTSGKRRPRASACFW